MPDREPSDRYSPEPNILERKAADYLAQLSSADVEWHERTPAEADAIRRATHRAVILAALAGIVSGGIIGGTEVWIRQGAFDGDIGWREQLPYWIGFFAFASVISAIEIAYLYAVALNGIARVTGRSGLALGGDGYPQHFARGLGRAALEFPNPRVLIFGIDPYAYVPRWLLAAKNIAYKLKVGVSSFVLRVFLRRVVARMAIRGFVPLIAGPLYAAWNAIIVWRIMREARIRTLGPFAVEHVVSELFGEGEGPGGAAADAILQGAGEMLMRGYDAHPNQIYLLMRLREELGVEGTDSLRVDWTGQRQALKSLGEADRERLLKVLTLSAILGSSTSRQQKRLLREAYEACGTEFRPEGLKQLRAKLKDGRRITADDFDKVKA